MYLGISPPPCLSSFVLAPSYSADQDSSPYHADQLEEYCQCEKWDASDRYGTCADPDAGGVKNKGVAQTAAQNEA